jgi:ribosomal protein L7/L12
MAPTKSSEKREKFVRLAERRTVNAIRAIRVLAKLGNKSAYDFNDGDAKRIVNALQREVDSLKARMSARGSKEEVEFKLEDKK